MELSLFLAKLIGLYMLITGVIILIRRDQFKRVVQSFASSEGLITLSGAVSLIAGLAILLSHSVWEWSWRGLISLIGVLAIIQGLYRLIFTDELADKLSSLRSEKTWLCIWATTVIVTLVLGGYLTYMGFRP